MREKLRKRLSGEMLYKWERLEELLRRALTDTELKAFVGYVNTQGKYTPPFSDIDTVIENAERERSEYDG